MESANETEEVLAAVDLGSNSFHMIIARLRDGQFQVMDRLREMVQLRAGLDEDNYLSEAAQDRAIGCLERFGERVRDLPYGKVRVVGTNTLRVAETVGQVELAEGVVVRLDGDALVVDPDLLRGGEVVVDDHPPRAADQRRADLDRSEPVHVAVRQHTAFVLYRQVHHRFHACAGVRGAGGLHPQRPRRPRLSQRQRLRKRGRATSCRW